MALLFINLIYKIDENKELVITLQVYLVVKVLKLKSFPEQINVVNLRLVIIYSAFWAFLVYVTLVNSRFFLDKIKS